MKKNIDFCRGTRVGLNGDHQNINLLFKTTLRPAQRKAKNEGYLVLTFVKTQWTNRHTDKVKHNTIYKLNAGYTQVLGKRAYWKSVTDINLREVLIKFWLGLLMGEIPKCKYRIKINKKELNL